ncbi:MAG: DUF4270 family protein [Ginsengibacter sp.]
MSTKDLSIFYFICSLSFLFCACEKVDVTFTDNVNDNDPNVTYLDNYTVSIATLKLDSFVTSGHQIFMLGSHQNSSFGKINADSYTEIQLPSSNPVKDKNVIFDSLELVLSPNGNYLGDTNTIFKLSVHHLNEYIENIDEGVGNTNFYYPRTFSYDPASIGQIITQIQPNKNKEISIRLSDAIGLDWLTKLKKNSTEIQSQDNFRAYFKGICITSDSLINKSLFYFKGADSTNTTVLRLHYRENTATFVDKILEFTFVAAKQFNNIRFNFTGTPFASFLPYKKQVLSSELMGHKAYVNNNIPSYAKITFPNLLVLKELYPYVKLLRAELDIPPSPGTYTYPYRLPPTLAMYVSNSDNNIDGSLTDANGDALTGNLNIDYLYGDNTHYSFDITTYINTLLEEGKFSTKALLLGTSSDSHDDNSSQLIFNDQQTSNGIKLKLYVLGL